MTIKELVNIIDGDNKTPELDLEKEVTCGYTCDLLSWVMAHGKEGMAWITVQTHINVIAVAVLMEMACVIICEGIQIEPASLAKAKKEGVAVIQSKLSAYELCSVMSQAGLPADA